MTLSELSLEYQAHAAALRERIRELRLQREELEEGRERQLLEERIRVLTTMLREANELAAVTGRYYERGYRRNERYTL